MVFFFYTFRLHKRTLVPNRKKKEGFRVNGLRKEASTLYIINETVPNPLRLSKEGSEDVNVPHLCGVETTSGTSSPYSP